jgi:Putative Ig domain
MIGVQLTGVALAVRQIVGNIVGGVAIGSAGEPGTIYEGYTLSWGDDFNSLDILAPHTPRGRWWTTRTYLAGSRGSDTLLGTMYDTDPYFTGYNDSNKGVPVGYNNMSLSGSVLRLEQTHMQSVRNEVAAMIAGPGAVHWFPGAAGTQDIIYEARVRFSAAAGNPAGWHPTLWLQSLNPTIAIDSDELDWEGNSQFTRLNQNIWTGGNAGSVSATGDYTHDGQMHTIAFVINTTNVRLFVDGVLFTTGSWNGNTKSKPQYPLLTSHVYSGTFYGEAYNQSAWNADADGASLDVDWMRVWRRTGRDHTRPVVALNDVNVDYGASTIITIPSALSLWGDASVTEYLQCVYNEENEPGVTHTSIYTQFPAGVSYNSGTRQLTVNITSGKTGRLNFVLSAWKTGGTGEPARFAVNVGPRITASALSATQGSPVSFDLYAACDCGVLTSNGAGRAKTIVVTGLPAGLSYSDTTGLITGTPTGTGSGNYSVTVTNSVGQSATAAIAYTVSAAATGVAAPTLTGSPTLLASWDFADNTRLTNTGALIDQITGSDGTTHTLASTGTARPSVVTRSGRQVAQFSGGQALQKIGSVGISNQCTIVTIFEPTSVAANSCLVQYAAGPGVFGAATQQHTALISSSTGIQHRKHDGTNQSIASVGSVPTLAPHLAVGTSFSGSTAAELNIDGAGAAIVAGALAAGPSGIDRVTMGRTGAATPEFPYNGYISRVLVYSTPLNATQREEVAAWAAANYGTPNVA